MVGENEMMNGLEVAKFIAAIIWVALWYDLKNDGDFDYPRICLDKFLDMRGTTQFETLSDLVNKLADRLKRKTK